MRKSIKYFATGVAVIAGLSTAIANFPNAVNVGIPFALKMVFGSEEQGIALLATVWSRCIDMLFVLLAGSCIWLGWRIGSFIGYWLNQPKQSADQNMQPMKNATRKVSKTELAAQLQQLALDTTEIVAASDERLRSVEQRLTATEKLLGAGERRLEQLQHDHDTLDEVWASDMSVKVSARSKLAEKALAVAAEAMIRILRGVPFKDCNIDIVEMGLIHTINVDEQFNVTVDIVSLGKCDSCAWGKSLTAYIEKILMAVEGVASVRVKQLPNVIWDISMSSMAARTVLNIWGDYPKNERGVHVVH